MPTDNESSEDDKKTKRWSGTSSLLEDFDKRIARWCRKKYGTEIGNLLWSNEIPDFASLDNTEFRAYCEKVWDGINDVSSVSGKALRANNSGFWVRDWHTKWVRKQYDKIHDFVEASVKGSAALEVESLGMEKSMDLRKHLTKHFGGSGDDVRAEEERFEEGLPENAGSSPCPEGFNMEEWLRRMEAKRVALKKMCASSKRDKYEMGFKTKLVKIVMKCLKGTSYQVDVDSLVQEIKMKKNMEARLPTLNATTGVLEMPTNVLESEISDDWDYRNYNDDWLPSWAELKSKLISSWKAKGFGHQSKKVKFKLPVMLNPGFGSSPKTQCFGCGKLGHRRGDPQCEAPEGAWASCAPPKFREKASGTSTKKFGGKRKAGVSGLTGTGGDGICYAYRDTGKCKFGPNCRYKHERGPSTKKVKLFKANKKGITVAAVKSLAAKIKKAAKERDDTDLDDNELNQYIASFCFVKTIPRECFEVLDIDVPAMATSDLIDMDQHACYDSGSGTGITTERSDMVWVNDSKAAKNSVKIRGPSVGKPGCEGRGALVFRKVVNGIPYGIVHPDGVLAEKTVGFRIASERLLGQDGLRFVGGEFNRGCKLQCVRSKVEVPMATEDNILVLETVGKASEIVDSPEFRSVVEEVRKGKRSPLVDLTPFLPGSTASKGDIDMSSGNVWASTMSTRSFLFKFLMLTATIMIFNEAKATPEQRSRLWVRKFGYPSSSVFRYMASMPEFGDFPNLPVVNEDDLVADLAKFNRKSFPKNDPEVSMSCPPWWRIKCDGYGGQNSLGGESREGAVGAYLFVCVSTGSVDHRLYASHTQFPIALHQFLTRVEAEHFTCKVIYVDTHSVNLSAEAEEVAALFKCVILPVSAGTPQEMAHAESMVRTVKRRSTAMMAGAPHLGPDMWALCDKYAIYVHDFLPISTRNFHCPFYLRTGRTVPWKILSLHVMGAPCIYAPMVGPIHKRGEMNMEGHFV